MHAMKELAKNHKGKIRPKLKLLLRQLMLFRELLAI